MNLEIVKPIRHRSSHHSSNPRSSRRIADLLALGRSSSGSISSSIHLLSLISDFVVVVVVAWVVLVLLFSDFGLISDLMIFFFFMLGIENLGFDEFGFCWI